MANVNMEDKNVFMLSTLTSLSGKVTELGWISYLLRKDVTADSYKSLYLSGKQLKALLKNIEKIDAVIGTFDGESKQLAEIPLGQGERRVAIFARNKRIWLEVRTYIRDPREVEEGAGPSVKRRKGSAQFTVKSNINSVSLTMQEWTSLKGKVIEIKSSIASLEVELVTGDVQLPKSVSLLDEQGDVPATIMVYHWTSYNSANGSVDKSSLQFYIKKHCLEEGQSFQMSKQRTGDSMIEMWKIPCPDVDVVMRAAYVARARLLMDRVKKASCEACVSGDVDLVNEAKHECQRIRGEKLDKMFAQVRSQIEIKSLRRMASAFLHEIEAQCGWSEVADYEFVYNEDLIPPAKDASIPFFESIQAALMYIKKRQLAEEDDRLSDHDGAEPDDHDVQW
jgi:hypothetical protein